MGEPHASTPLCLLPSFFLFSETHYTPKFYIQTCTDLMPMSLIIISIALPWASVVVYMKTTIVSIARKFSLRRHDLVQKRNSKLEVDRGIVSALIHQRFIVNYNHVVKIRAKTLQCSPRDIRPAQMVTCTGGNGEVPEKFPLNF